VAAGTTWEKRGIAAATDNAATKVFKLMLELPFQGTGIVLLNPNSRERYVYVSYEEK
jgi:hypothetical protein